nr:Chain E, iCAL36-TRL peptide [synthetic construct]4K76_F Chain F, iCAL36-TRL peptide [synthetic construct]4K76_G Chain G, iCAL36-TRL peptide [synthetic construct]4K76_H Chain H, iCAL36-TRL peptide [synthetic construct]
ANSRWPTTRL